MIVQNIAKITSLRIWGNGFVYYLAFSIAPILMSTVVTISFPTHPGLMAAQWLACWTGNLRVAGSIHSTPYAINSDEFSHTDKL